MVVFREVQGLTSGHTIRCHHFIVHQDREISVRSGAAVVLMEDFISNYMLQPVKPIRQQLWQKWRQERNL